MTKKVGKDELKKLIEEVLKEDQLNEKTAFPFDNLDTDWGDVFGNNLSSAQKTSGFKKDTDARKKIQALAGEDGDSSELDVSDFNNISTKSKNTNAYKAAKAIKDFGRNSSVRSTATQGLAGTLNPGSAGTIEDPDKFNVGTAAQADQGLNVYEPESIAFGQMANIGMQNSDPNNNVGEIQLGIGTAMKTFFKGKTTFKSRIDALNTFTKGIFIDDQLPNKMKELLQATLISDYLSTIVTEMDSGSGAYNFESFLAAMAGGSVTGKSSEPTLSEGTGQMGATDFVTADGSMGSAKYYSSGSNLTQAISNFENKKGKTTLYVIAIKKSQTTGQAISGTTTTSDPTQIKALDIYLVSVMPTTNKPGEVASDWSIKINGQDAGLGKFSDGKIVVSASDNESIANATPIKLYITGGPNATLKDKLNDLTKNNADDIQKAYQRFQSLFENLTAANQNAQAYAADGDKNKGEKAMSTLQDSDKELLNLVDLITKSQNQSLDKTTRKITTEQKITANFLKKLIQEKFKK